MFNLQVTAQVKKNVQDINNRNLDIKPGNIHLTDANANKFLGSWKWKDNTRHFTLILKKSLHQYGSIEKPAAMELIKGYYIYNNGVNEVNTINDSTVTGSTEGEINTAYLLISDKKANKVIEFKIISVNPNTVKFELSPRNKEGYDHRNTLNLPANILLTKVN